MLRAVAKACLLPPGCCLVLALLALATWRRWPKLGRALLVVAAAFLWLFATPLVGGALLGSLQPDDALDPAVAKRDAQAIVILSAEADLCAPEFGRASGWTVGKHTLVRLRYGARLHRETGLPILVTGRSPEAGAPPVAELMAETLRDEFGVPVQWIEPLAATTWLNAFCTAELLRPLGIDTVCVVTHAWHQPRAAMAFEAHGLNVLRAPTGFRGPAWSGWRALLPSWKAVRDSYWGLHERLGMLFYALRGTVAD